MEQRPNKSRMVLDKTKLSLGLLLVGGVLQESSSALLTVRDLFGYELHSWYLMAQVLDEVETLF